MRTVIVVVLRTVASKTIQVLFVDDLHVVIEPTVPVIFI
jgi:hypothetical protein